MKPITALIVMALITIAIAAILYCLIFGWLG